MLYGNVGVRAKGKRKLYTKCILNASAPVKNVEPKSLTSIGFAKISQVKPAAVLLEDRLSKKMGRGAFELINLTMRTTSPFFGLQILQFIDTQLGQHSLRLPNKCCTI